MKLSSFSLAGSSSCIASSSSLFFVFKMCLQLYGYNRDKKITYLALLVFLANALSPPKMHGVAMKCLFKFGAFIRATPGELR